MISTVDYNVTESLNDHLFHLTIAGQRQEMEIGDTSRLNIPSLPDIQVPVTSQHETASFDRQHPLVPEPQFKLTSLEQRYSERPFMLPPRYQTTAGDLRFLADRLSEPRFSEPRPQNSSSLAVPFPTSSSNYPILEESRAISSLPLTSLTNNVSSDPPQPLLTELYSSINPSTSMSTPFLPTSPQLPANFSHISHFPHLSQNRLINSYLPNGEIVTYQSLDPIPTNDLMVRRQNDIPVKLERPLMPTVTRLALEGAPSGALPTTVEDRNQHHTEMHTNQSPFHPDVTSTPTGVPSRSPPRTGRTNNGDSNVWRPY